MNPETETLHNELVSLKANIAKACGLPGFNRDVAIRKLQEHEDVMRFKVAVAEAIGLRSPHVSCDRVLQEVKARSAQQWISVSERLPEHQQRVIFVVSEGNGERFQHLHGLALGGEYCARMGVFFTPGLGLTATHWQPLPEPPR